MRPYLQDVVILRALGDSDLLGDGQRVHEVFVWDLMQLLTVICERIQGGKLYRAVFSPFKKKDSNIWE